MRGLEGPVRVSEQYVWMAPASYLLVFGVVAALLLLIGRWIPALVTPHAGAFAFSLLGGAGVLALLPGRLHWTAIALLAAGIAWQVARAVARRGPGFERLVRRSVWWLAALVVLFGLVGSIGRTLDERRARAALPPAPPGAPNVLLLILDTVRAKSLSVYGYGRPTTPALERLAARGVVFERAIAPAPWTLPSHATMFTGRQPHEHGASWTTPLDSAYPTLAEVLGARGYVTAGFAANLLFCDRTYGLARGFARYEDYPASLGQIVLSSAAGRFLAGRSGLRRLLGHHEVLNRKNAATVTDDFLAWLDREDDTRPFFAFLNYFDAHEPYLPPAPYAGRFGPRRRDVAFDHVVTVEHGSRAEVRDKWSLGWRDAEAERAAYDGAIAYLDAQLGRLFAELERRGRTDGTIVIVTSDHGEQFGEHGLYGHINSLYTQVLHVPLIVAYPGGAPAGVRVSAAVSLRDLPATALDLAALGRGPFPGASLARFWRGGAGAEPVLSAIEHTELGEPWYPVAAGDGRAIVFAGYHLIEFAGEGTPPRVELYDLARDFEQRDNLALAAAGAQPLGRLRAMLDSLTIAPAATGEGGAGR